MRSSRVLWLAPLAALAAACGGHSGARAPAPSTLAVTVTSGGSVSGDPPATSCALGSCSTAQPGGALVTLTPDSLAGWAFAGWSGDCAGTGTCTLTMTSSRSVTASFAPNAPLGSNLVTLTVNGDTCRRASGAYPNKPCVRVTVCLPGTSTCVLVDDILLDTGSYGLRLFKEVLPFPLPVVTVGAGTLAECVQFLDGSSDWGPVATADVRLGGEPVIQIPVQVIDATFSQAPASCPKPETSAAAAGLGGILGVGLFAEDCGAGCASNAGNGIYFSCVGASCSGIAVATSSQVPNPVAWLPVDNNGIIVDLPPVQLGGQRSVSGSLILGIDTQPNNGSAGATAYAADPRTGNIRTSFDGASLGAFLDTGSNGLFFPAPRAGTLPACAAPNSAWYCPALTTGLVATNSGATGSPSGPVTFSIGNAVALFGGGNAAFSELGGPSPAGAGFDFGLPFFFGQRVLVGTAGTRPSKLGSGPYVAY